MVKKQRLYNIKLILFFSHKLNQLKASSLFPRMSYNFSCFIFVNRMPAEVTNPKIKETSDEIISVTDDTKKEFVDIDEDLLEVEIFTQEEMDAYPSDYEG